MNQSSIIVKNLSVNLQGINVLDNISFQLNPYRNLAVIGSSGSGKTMLAKALSNQLFHKGNIEINFNKASALNQKIYFVEQHYHFKNRSNVSQFYYQQRYNSFDSEDASTVEDELKLIDSDDKNINFWLTKLKLIYRKHAPLLQLSSGEHKRFQLAKAFLSQPQILILDSPFHGLDIDTRIQLNNIINDIAATGMKIIIIADTHEIPGCITHIIELEKGKLKTFGQKENFHFQNHKNYFSEKPFSANKLPEQIESLSFHNAVKMINVSVSYSDKKILQNINWQIKKGERWLLKGCNGVGKSTLLSLITGDNPKAYSNKIYLFDKRRGSGESIWDIKKNIGYVSPELQWYFEKSISCHEVIASGFFDTIGLFKNISLPQQKTIQQWMDILNISSCKNKMLSTVSSGTQRLVLLARALVKSPSMLVLDEPCQGLDEKQVQKFISVIDTICTGLNTTLIYVSHYENEIPECVDKVFEIKNDAQNIYYINKKFAFAI